jgi:hypothetical protein
VQGRCCYVRVVFNDERLGRVCSRRRLLAQRWGESAASVELALCTLRAASTLPEFLALPNVIQEDDVIFRAHRDAVHLMLSEVHLGGSLCVAVGAVSVSAESPR